MFGLVEGDGWLQNCGFWELPLVDGSTLDEWCIYHMCGGGGYITYCARFWEFLLVWDSGGYITYCGGFWKFSMVGVIDFANNYSNIDNYIDWDPF